MSRSKVILICSIVAGVGVAGFFLKAGSGSDKRVVTEETSPFKGDIRLTVATTGIVKPQNRLEIKPSIGGRIDEILVREGDKVQKGQILAWMSSTERAALVDAAGFQGDEARTYWEDVYKKTPIISPIDGEIIVRSVEPGQTVTTGDVVVVLSDRLIVSAQFDETDIGRVKVGQKAVLTLDAYPDREIEGSVDHIAYESNVFNNVTIYDVDIVPREIPDFFRSGMSANVEVIEKERAGVLLVPLEALHGNEKGEFVTVKEPGGVLKARPVEIGLRNEKNAEVVKGLSADDVIVVKERTLILKKGGAAGTNPFMPSHRPSR